MPQVYLDNAATTKLDARVLTAMKPFWFQHYANASSIHLPGQANDIKIRDCKTRIAKLIKGSPDNIIFTASATEANNLIIKGIMRANSAKGNHLIVSAIEHPCVLNSARELAAEGFEVDFLGVDKYGLVDLKKLADLITPSTVLVSVMAVNNEIGVVQDLAAIGKLVHSRGAYFHTDAVQAVPYLQIDVKKSQIDCLSLSAHKFHGPQGVGLAYIDRTIKIKPLIVGGGQEDGRRAGTYNLPGIVGLTTALELSYRDRTVSLKKFKTLSSYLWQRIKKEIPEVALNGSLAKRAPHILNVRFSRIEGEAILMDLSFQGVSVSTGSACSAQNLRASTVLAALGLADYDLNSNIRFSLGKNTTKAEIDYTIKCLKKTVSRLRSPDQSKKLKKTINY